MSTRGELARIARLAGLAFTDAELDRIAVALDDILDRVAELDSVAVADVPAFRHPVERGALRPDVPGSDVLTTSPSNSTPGWHAGFFTVRRLPTHGERE